MKYAKELLNRIQSQTGWSDYATAKHIGVSRSVISSIRTGRTESLEDELAIKFADILNLDRLDVVALMHIERSKSAMVTKFWISVISDTGLTDAGLNTSIDDLTKPRIKSVDSTDYMRGDNLFLKLG